MSRVLICYIYICYKPHKVTLSEHGPEKAPNHGPSLHFLGNFLGLNLLMEGMSWLELLTMPQMTKYQKGQKRVQRVARPQAGDSQVCGFQRSEQDSVALVYRTADVTYVTNWAHFLNTGLHCVQCVLIADASQGCSEDK